MIEIRCRQCEIRMSASRLALRWTSNIPCRACGANHTCKRAPLIGSAYVLALAAITIAIKVFAHQFVTVTDGRLYSTSPLQAFLELGAPLFAIALAGPAYVWLIARGIELKQS